MKHTTPQRLLKRMLLKPMPLWTLPFLCLGFLQNQAIAEDFLIDTEKDHAFVQFKASHLGYSFVMGRFNEFAGTFSYDEADPSQARVNITIDTASIDTNHAERDKHLRSGDFFDADRYPTITFDSTAFEEADNGTGKLTGDLSLHGVVRPVTIDVRHIGHGDDPWGGYRRGLEGITHLDSAEYGFPGWVGDVEIYLVVEGIRQ